MQGHLCAGLTLPAEPYVWLMGLFSVTKPVLGPTGMSDAGTGLHYHRGLKLPDNKMSFVPQLHRLPNGLICDRSSAVGGTLCYSHHTWWQV